MSLEADDALLTQHCLLLLITVHSCCLLALLFITYSVDWVFPIIYLIYTFPCMSVTLHARTRNLPFSLVTGFRARVCRSKNAF